LSTLLHKHQASVWAKHISILKAHAAFARRSGALCQHAAELCVDLELPARVQILSSKATDAGSSIASGSSSTLHQQQQQGRFAELFANCQLLASSLTGSDAKECLKNKGAGFVLEGECLVMCTTALAATAETEASTAAVSASAASGPPCNSGSSSSCRGRSSCAGNRSPGPGHALTPAAAADLGTNGWGPSCHKICNSSKGRPSFAQRACMSVAPARRGGSMHESSSRSILPGAGRLGGNAALPGHFSAGTRAGGERQQVLVLARLSKGDMLSSEALKAFEDKQVSCVPSLLSYCVWFLTHELEQRPLKTTR
jgi:hypothetical protein